MQKSKDSFASLSKDGMGGLTLVTTKVSWPSSFHPLNQMQSGVTSGGVGFPSASAGES